MDNCVLDLCSLACNCPCNANADREDTLSEHDEGAFGQILPSKFDRPALAPSHTLLDERPVRPS